VNSRRITAEDLADLDDHELDELEREVERLIAVWQVKNLRGTSVFWFDDQRIGEPRRELHALGHASVDAEALLQFRRTPVVDSLQGNMLVHPLMTPVVEVDERAERARGVWSSLGIEALSKFRETPTAIFSIGFVPGSHVKENGEWRILQGMWQRTTKNEYHAGWVRDMQVTNTRPPLSAEEDRARLGRYAYRPDEVRAAHPEPPRTDTWDEFPDETDDGWQRVNLD